MSTTPKPYYEDERAGIVIYHGDCREVLPQIETASVDLVLTDPPYGIGYASSRRKRTDPLASPIEGDLSLNSARDVMPSLDRLLKLDRHAYVFASPLRIGEAAEVVADYWGVKNVIVWDKGEAGTVGDLKCGYAWNWEPIIYAMKGRRPLNGSRPRCIYRYDWSGVRDPVHPTVKPVGLLRWLISKSSDAGERVIDPFMGSGTTLKAAKELGRKCVGVELNESYCEAAARRLEQGVFSFEGAA